MYKKIIPKKKSKVKNSGKNKIQLNKHFFFNLNFCQKQVHNIS